MEKLRQDLHFLLGPGFSSTLPHSNRNVASNAIEVRAIL